MRALFGLVLLAALPAAAGDPSRTLKAFYENRAYPAAPPQYRHELEGDVGWAGDACLSCHKKGSSGAPMMPHASFGECRMCHAHLKVSTVFKPTTFVSTSLPERHVRALPGSPVVAPHPPSFFRQKCLSCHGEKNGVKDVKSPHPERGACVQCHVPQRTVELFTRPAPVAPVGAAMP